MWKTFKSYLLAGASWPVLVWAAPVWVRPEPDRITTIEAFRRLRITGEPLVIKC